MENVEAEAMVRPRRARNKFCRKAPTTLWRLKITSSKKTILRGRGGLKMQAAIEIRRIEETIPEKRIARLEMPFAVQMSIRK